MPLYPFRCQECGAERDEFMHMSEYQSEIKCECGGVMNRYYTPPFDHTENTFKPRWDWQLSPGVDPVYIKSRDQWNRMMKAQGVQPGEPGIIEDAQKNRKERKAKADAEIKKELDHKLDKAFDQAVGAYGGV